MSRLYRAVLEQPVEERRAFLDAACRGDEELRGEIESLLMHDEHTEAFPGLEVAKAASGGSGPQGSLTEIAGRYRLDRELGRGGMGVAYAAYADYW